MNSDLNIVSTSLQWSKAEVPKLFNMKGPKCRGVYNKCIIKHLKNMFYLKKLKQIYILHSMSISFSPCFSPLVIWHGVHHGSTLGKKTNLNILISDSFTIVQFHIRAHKDKTRVECALKRWLRFGMRNGNGLISALPTHTRLWR